MGTCNIDGTGDTDIKTTAQLSPKNYVASSEIWIAMIHKNFAATAKLCKHCREASKNLKHEKDKEDVAENYVTREPKK